MMGNKSESGKNPSVNRVPSKMDFFTIDFTTGFPKSAVKKFILEGTLLTDDFFFPDSDLFSIIVIRKGSLSFGTFGLG